MHLQYFQRKQNESLSLSLEVWLKKNKKYDRASLHEYCFNIFLKLADWSKKNDKKIFLGRVINILFTSVSKIH